MAPGRIVALVCVCVTVSPLIPFDTYMGVKRVQGFSLSPHTYCLLSAPFVCCDHGHTAVLSDTAADMHVLVTA